MPDATLAPAHDDCVYAAGVYDGEGWVTVTHRVRRERHYYTAVAGLSNSDRQVLEWHRERWGGWVMGPKTNRLEQSFSAAISQPRTRARLLGHTLDCLSCWRAWLRWERPNCSYGLLMLMGLKTGRAE